MPRVVFWKEGAGEPCAALDAEPGDSLLDLARLHDVPLHWRCGQGTCGTCVVRLSHQGQPGLVPVSSKERNVLARAGFADPERQASPEWPDRPDVARLACHCRAGDSELTVYFLAR
ncbi:2Fe-2S iron-sulfur cluster-binding protein [Paludibacterium paludis]|uniref:2Fe-2S ferredoxin-type domain-containing protein n=1 Tax=Paludibacterium paludis TaxID=1225769 RepID=A0A918P6E3_9NEIS|nr:2Fe-2S iron-sulfur cluster-binding protein [Paludibacterium paludis]GGY25509.1 hypothetical protein GCM10011289_31400 [Paludibacterium paludis]